LKYFGEVDENCAKKDLIYFWGMSKILIVKEENAI